MLKFPRGFSLIELMIALVILAVLSTHAAPSFSAWINNMKIRTAAEAVLSGLQLTRTEALKRNTVMSFQFTDTMDSSCALSAAGPHWIISRNSAEGACDSEPSSSSGTSLIVQKYDGTQTGGDMTKIESTQALFEFNGLGRLITPKVNTSLFVTGVGGKDGCVSEDAGGKARCLRIDISSGGGIRMCDPALPSTNIQGCE